MRPRADSHLSPCHALASNALGRLRGAGVAKTLLAGVLLLVATLAPFSESWHEASVQHVRCAEHGELTHVTVSAGDVADAHRAGAGRLAVKRGDASQPAGHEHCAVAFIVRGNTQPPAVHATVRPLPPHVIGTKPALVLPPPGRAFLLASAPKTSPPVV